MKHRTINKVRTNKSKKILRQKRTAGISDIKSHLMSIYNQAKFSSNTNVANWNSNTKGTYVKQKHGDI